MNEFRLNERLQTDCARLGEMELSVLLLMNNALVPWFILVPKVPDVVEIYQLDPPQQRALLREIDLLSAFLKDTLDVDKINVASIGNLVEQLHVHVIGRYKHDYCWPQVVWGRTEVRPYRVDELQHLAERVQDSLGDRLVG